MNVNVFFGVLTFIAVVLTWTMFSTRQMMLGFPCAMFWAILGGFALTQSVIDWDLFYLVFFASMGMTIFSMLAMYGLRTKKQEARDGDNFLDEQGKDVRYTDEGKNPDGQSDPSLRIAEAGDPMQFSASESSGRASGRSSKRSKEIRNRADRRRTKGVLKAPDFGEFK